MVKRVLPVVVMAALVVFAGAVLLRQPSRTTDSGTITSVAPGAVCLRTHGQAVCLDRQHVEHLALRQARSGECVEATWSGNLVVPESMVSVVQRSC